jgi:hypothetical protein
MVTRNLVFCYDMNNTGKSWLGAPTINRVAPAWISWGIDGSGTVNIGTRTILSDWHCRINDYNHNTRQSIYVTGLSGSTTYTFSVKFKKLEGAPTLRFQLQSYNGGTFLGSVFPTTVQLGLTDKEGWQTAFFSYTTSAGADRVLWFMQDGDDYVTYTHSFELKEPQCEQQSFVTPFVAGTRSNTQAIVDLTNTNVVTANALTYNSNNTFSFNNIAASALSIPDSSITRPTSVTVSAWVKMDVYNPLNDFDGSFPTIAWKCNSDNSGGGGSYGLSLANPNPRFAISSTQLISASPLTYGVWVNLVGTYTVGSGAMILYRNGTVDASATGPASIPYSAQVFSVGSRIFNGGYQYPWNGSIGLVQLYNRALSAIEVRQNFNAHRGRYNL